MSFLVPSQKPEPRCVQRDFLKIAAIGCARARASSDSPSEITTCTNEKIGSLIS